MYAGIGHTLPHDVFSMQREVCKGRIVTVGQLF